jgi:hypothetical protein
VQELQLNRAGSAVTWTRSGASPELWRTSFEYSPDGVSWTKLGNGKRHGSRWRCTTLPVPWKGYVRARGRAVGGLGDGSASLVESVRAHVRHFRPILNDYDRDGASDLAVYQPSTGKWYIRAVSNAAAIVWDVTWGGPNAVPVAGDYDGDRTGDLAVHMAATGNTWRIRSAATATPPILAHTFNDITGVPVPGDYSGSGDYDCTVYDRAAGRWSIWGFGRGEGFWIASGFEVDWGGPTMEPVPGDYDGDGAWDLACYERATGNWYIRSGLGEDAPIRLGLQWGGPGMVPVPGDYDGDGFFDLAMYQQATGNWYILKLGRDGSADEALCFGLNWGGAWGDPVPGDYNRDGVWDLAVYERATAKWFILNRSSGAAIAFGLNWGDATMDPVGVCR